ncbi:MAG: PilZ domain-containing protein [Kofleriaceae bacterium]|nr:PilZ domain-containing protein [Kofleriaceae bacterium]
MQSTDVTPLVEAFLLIEQPRQRLGHWIRALTPLDAPTAPTVNAIVAYYDPTCDQALLNLQYEAHVLGAAKLDYVVNVALLAEVGMIQPAELSEGERVRFLAERLTRCTIRVTSKRDAVGALTELVRKIKDSRQPPVRAPSPRPPTLPPPKAVQTVQPRGDTDDPIMLVAAKGTRDNLEPLAKEARARNPTVRAKPISKSSMLGDGPEPPPPPRRQDTAVVVDPPLPPPSDRTSRHVIRAVERLKTVEMPPALADEYINKERQASPPPTAEPYVSAGAKTSPTMIYARYLRSGRWVPVRVGALSLKGAALLTGALPRLQDRVDIALTYGSHRALVRGAVGKVSSVREAQQTGAATFSVAFELDDVSKKQLTTLLTAARDAKVTIKPPPARATRRYPVEWPVALGTPKGAVKGLALDISTGGMFVKPAVALDMDSVLNFSVMLDDGSAPVAGRAKVVRQITAPEAKACGLAPGFGLTIVDMSQVDGQRWLAFLSRIERRADKRVLIGAEPARLAELQAGLASCGYAVVGGTDPGALVQLANADSRPADAVLIDAGWLQGDAATTLVESLFSARNVPCVTMTGEVRRARQAIDKLLEVVV